MSYSELVHAYFERSTALQWYWTVYILVIGGLMAFSTFRRHKEIVTTILVTALYGGFAYKNLGAIEATTAERNALLAALKACPESPDVARVRTVLEPTLTGPEYEGYRAFHIACDLLTVAFLWTKEWSRKAESGMQPQGAG